MSKTDVAWSFNAMFLHNLLLIITPWAKVSWHSNCYYNEFCRCIECWYKEDWHIHLPVSICRLTLLVGGMDVAVSDFFIPNLQIKSNWAPYFLFFSCFIFPKDSYFRTFQKQEIGNTGIWILISANKNSTEDAILYVHDCSKYLRAKGYWAWITAIKILFTIPRNCHNQEENFSLDTENRRFEEHIMTNQTQHIKDISEHYENMLVQIYWKFYHPKKWKFSEKKKKSDIFHISAQNIHCGNSLEPPRWGGSNEYPQYMFLSRNQKIIYTSVNPSFTI